MYIQAELVVFMIATQLASAVFIVGVGLNAISSYRSRREV